MANARMMGTVAALVVCMAGGGGGAAEPPISKNTLIERLAPGGSGEIRLRGPRTQTVSGQSGEVSVQIYFETNSAEILPESFEQIRAIADAVEDERLRPYRFAIEGHTDHRGSAAPNLRLSQRRAEAVRRYLIERFDVTAVRLEAHGYGESRPLHDVPQDTEQGLALNRRVVVVNLDRATARPSEGARPTSGTPSVEVRVRYQRGGQTRMLEPNTLLRPEDNYNLTFTPDRESWVYAYQIDAKGTISPLFPNDAYTKASNPVAARQTYVVPSGGEWLALDDVAGREEIIVLASETQVPDPSKLALRLWREADQFALRGPAPAPRLESGLPDPPPNLFTYRLHFEHAGAE